MPVIAAIFYILKSLFLAIILRWFFNKYAQSSEGCHSGNFDPSAKSQYFSRILANRAFQICHKKVLISLRKVKVNCIQRYVFLDRVGCTPSPCTRYTPQNWAMFFLEQIRDSWYSDFKEQLWF